MATPKTIGRYNITGVLGQGAMGIVYRGVDPALDRPVAIKVISAGETAQDASLEELEGRFLREARIAARINHPGVVTVHDAGREGDNLYIVMELVEGESLADQRNRGVQRSYSESFLLAAEVAEALAAAHELTVVHRDIKPANILLTKEGRVKVTDFGVAKAVGDRTELTRTGMVIGSPAYMAPEQVKGTPVTTRADLFSLGVVLYEMLFGRKPFPADTVTTLIYQILHEDPVADQEIIALLGPDVAAFLKSCLAKNADDRMKDAATFARRARELAAKLREISVEATTATLIVERTVPQAAAAGAAKVPTKMPAWLPLAATAAGSLVVVVTIVMLVRGSGANEKDTLAAATPVVVVVTPTAAPFPTATPIPEPTATPLPTAPGPMPTLGFRRVGGGFGSPTDRTMADVSGEAGADQGAADAAGARESSPAPRPTSPPRRVRTVAAAPTAVPTTPAVTFDETYECRQAAQFNVSPKEARVAVDGQTIGVVRDFGGGFIGRLGGKLYSFPGPGTYVVEFSLDGYRTVTVQVVVRPAAEKRVADIDLKLPPLAGASSS